MTPKISVLVPVYNAEKYLHQCLDSLVGQTLNEIEILCINDGSTDSSLEILNEYSKKSDKITVLSKSNTGYGDSLNIGIEMSKADYIGIVEPDDYVETSMFEILLNNAITYDLDVSRCTYYNLEESSGLEYEERFSFMIKNKVYSPRDKPETFFQQPTDWINIYKKDFLNENGIRFLPTPGASFQDTSFLFKVYACANKFMICDQPLYHYRINDSSSVKANKSKIECICDEYDEIWNFVKQKGEVNRYKYLITQLQFYGYKWNCIRLDEECRLLFLKKWKSDFVSLKTKGYVRRFDYIPSDYTMLKQVISIGDKCENSAECGIMEHNDKKAKTMSSKFSFAARWYIRMRV